MSGLTQGWDKIHEYLHLAVFKYYFSSINFVFVFVFYSCKTVFELCKYFISNLKLLVTIAT